MEYKISGHLHNSKFRKVWYDGVIYDEGQASILLCGVGQDADHDFGSGCRSRFLIE